MNPALAKAVFEALKISAEKIQDYAQKKALLDEIEKLEKYTKDLEYGIINRDQVIDAQKNLIKKLRSQ
jgi:hypothetical protein